MTEQQKIINNNKKLKTSSKSIVWDLLSVALVVIFPLSYMYFRNFPLVKLSDFFITFLIFFGPALLIYFLALIFLKYSSKAAIIANLTMLAFMPFQRIESKIIEKLSFVNYWHLVYIFLSIIILVAIILKKRVKNETAGVVNRITSFVFGLLLLSNLALASPTIIKELQKEDVDKVSMQLDNESQDVGNNVYIFVFDEYAGLDGLERYTNYDNSEFYTKLDNIGFNTSPHSRNYTTTTHIEVPNLLNLSLILNEDNLTISAEEELLKSPALFALFQQQGYRVDVISDQSLIPLDADYTDSISTGLGNVSKVESFQLVALKASVVYPVLLEKAEGRALQIKQLFSALEESSRDQNQKRLKFAYLMFPHYPWVLDEKGNSISEADTYNWQNSNVYLGQLKYVSKRILSLSEMIVEEDPNAIILLFSDHGYRQAKYLKSHYGEHIEDMDFENQFQTNILNAVYYKGEKLDIEGLSAVNTLIKVLNQHFSMDIPSVEWKSSTP